MNSVPDLLLRYEAFAVAWDAEPSARKANRLFDRMHALSLVLRGTEEGRAGLEAMLGHPNRGVQLSASAVCLAWGSPAAVATLEALSAPRGRHSLIAETTLSEYRQGNLRFDW